jgi:FSR family fosmidomycin resistance protein-like MFS transporter
VFFGFAFGMAGSEPPCWASSPTLSVSSPYQLCAFLPMIGLLAAFLPDLTSPIQR